MSWDMLPVYPTSSVYRLGCDAGGPCHQDLHYKAQQANATSKGHRAGNWDPGAYAQSSRDDKPVRVRGSASLDEDSSCSSAITGQPLLLRGQGASGLANTQQAAGCYMLPMEFSTTSEQSVVRL